MEAVLAGGTRGGNGTSGTRCWCCGKSSWPGRSPSSPRPRLGSSLKGIGCHIGVSRESSVGLLMARILLQSPNACFSLSLSFSFWFVYFLFYGFAVLISRLLVCLVLFVYFLSTAFAILTSRRLLLFGYISLRRFTILTLDAFFFLSFFLCPLLLCFTY